MKKETKQIKKEYEIYKKWQREFKYSSRIITTGRLSYSEFKTQRKGYMKFHPGVKKMGESMIKKFILDNTNHVRYDFMQKMADYLGMTMGEFIKKWMKMGAKARNALIHEYIVASGGDTEGYENEDDFETSDFEDELEELGA